MTARILVVDDDRTMCELIEEDMAQRCFEVCWHTSAQDALERLKTEPFDVVLTDFRMPGMDGLTLCERIRTSWPDVPVIIITAFGSLETAISAIRTGAYDFVTKPISMDVLAIALERAANYHSLQTAVKTLNETVQTFRQYGKLVGGSEQMRALYDRVKKVAASDASVLITGESGTGKELVARTIHEEGRRSGGPFVAVNCASLPAPLLESELFGHVKGAFTDAREDRKGLFLQANGGTLVLDEITELPLSLQPKMLRALEERTVRPIGGDREKPFDVRIIAITNRDLSATVSAGDFREDLYYRVNVIRIPVPPLRDRRMDILVLAQHFMNHFRLTSGKEVTGISTAAAEKLLHHPWPGNVRELRNAIENAVALTSHEKIMIEDLPENLQSSKSAPMLPEGLGSDEVVPMAEVERRYILHVLKVVGGNQSHAARLLGYNRRTLHRKLHEYGVAEQKSKF